MTSNKNKQGLSRYIPSEILDFIIKNSYYGCVRCGDGFFQVEHIEPKFKDATEHNAQKMCLLCYKHHAEVTINTLDKVFLIFSKIELYF